MARSDWLRTFRGRLPQRVGDRGRVAPGPDPARRQPATRGAGTAPWASRSSCGSPTGMEPTRRDASSTPGSPNLSTGSRRCCATSMPEPCTLPEPPVRLGSSPEFFAAEVLPRLVGTRHRRGGRPSDATRTCSSHSDRGELDVVVTSSTPPRRSIGSDDAWCQSLRPGGGAAGGAPSTPVTSLERAGDSGSTGRPWVSYSLELPRTRRFWLSALGRPFSARLQLVVPDLRAVLKAVELGLGVSLVPEFVCRDALATDTWSSCSRCPI